MVAYWIMKAEDGRRELKEYGAMRRELIAAERATLIGLRNEGRIRNELQTMIPQALEHDGERIRVHLERINEMVLPREKQAAIRDVLAWYKVHHPVWFEWLDVV